MGRFIALSLLASAVTCASAFAAGNDDKHITFINQTNKYLEFNVDVPYDRETGGDDKHKKLHAHTANYQNMADTCYKEPFDITIKHVRGGGRSDTTVKSGIKRSCGQNLYIWHQDGEYKVNNEPHIKADLSGCNSDTKKPAILFAHGLNSKQGSWKDFVAHAKDKGWRVFRTSVSEDGSIAKRAYMLSAYISKAARECKIADGSLRVVAHSMGGLDIRYLVSNGLPGSKKIERIYTFATPHRGQGASGIIHTSDAVQDLGINQMADFNHKYPYSSMKVNHKQVPLLAIRFRCSDKDEYHDESDGVVKTFRQIFKEAPYSEKIYTGKHVSNLCSSHIRTEHEKTDVLDLVLRDHRDGNYVIPAKTY